MTLTSDDNPGQQGPSVATRRIEKFRPSREAEARLLLLIDKFSHNARSQRTLEGRVKLAKLDFLLRYPAHLAQVLAARGASSAELLGLADDEGPIDSRMMRYRYGPWDPAYYALLGSLIGRNLVEVVPLTGTTGFGYRTSDRGRQLASNLSDDESFAAIGQRLDLLKKYLDKSGTTLKTYIYELLPDVADANWHEEL
jgi:hypothetical protein